MSDNRSKINAQRSSLAESLRRSLQEKLGLLDRPDLDLDTEPLYAMAGPPQVNDDQSRINAWLYDIRDLLDMFPRAYKPTGKAAKVKREREQLNRLVNQHQVELRGLYEEGEIHADVSTRGEHFRVIIRDQPVARIQQGQQPGICNCPQSAGKNPCPHVYAACRHMLRNLDDVRSLLRQRLTRGQFDPGPPPSLEASVDPSHRLLRELDGWIKSAGIEAEAEESAGLPEIEQLRMSRLVWRVSVAGSSLDIEPIVQQAKKRGNGFTKGRGVPLQSLRDGVVDAPLTEVDRRVIKQIKAENVYGYYYRDSLKLSPFKALVALIGAPNVVWEDEPLEVLEAGYNVEIVSLANDRYGFRLRIRAPHVEWKGEGATTLLHEDVLLCFNRQAGQVMVISDTEARFRLARKIINFEGVTKEHLPGLIERAREMQHSLPIVLPESAIGKTIKAEVFPVLILRSRTDGCLDYGFRVRCSDGKLRLPGKGLPFMAGERDGEKVQYERDVIGETKVVQELAERLGLSQRDAEKWNGTIGDFEQGLMLLENLQELSQEVELLWDEKSTEAMSVIGHITSKNVSVQISSSRNWFGVSGTCEVGDRKIELERLLESLDAGSVETSRGDYIRLNDGSWTRISAKLKARLKRLRDATHTDRKKLKMDATAAPILRDLMGSGELQIDANRRWMECLTRLKDAESLDPQLPQNLQAELRDYQLEGYRWLRRLAEWGVGGVLADDMGLGKTLQTLAVLLDRADKGPALVIAPTSVGFNWVREAERFAPDLKVHLYRETDRADFLDSVGAKDLVICSYGLALRDETALAKVNWSTMVLDEAQAIKNSRSKTSIAIGNIPAEWTVALTGTPVENHLGELWSLFHVVSPGVFGGWESFRNRYAGPIERDGNKQAQQALADRLKPFVLRRTKVEVLKDLPPRTEMNLYVDLSAEEHARYEQVRLSALGEVAEIAELESIQDQRFKILAILTRLRQLACHVGLVDETWTKSSAKLDLLCETLESLREEGHRALVFSQFTKHLALIKQALETRGITYEYLDGSTPAHERQQRVDQFQNGKADAFLISLKAGGTGLNLTAADYVIHMDPWWNPAVEDQATDRAHRIGQDKPVMVYRIIAKGTVEEEILSLHGNKRDLVEGVMAGTQSAGKLNNEQLLTLLRS